MKILLATDGSAFSDAAIDEIARRPWPEGSELKILFAAEPFMPPVTETWVVPSDYYEEIERAADEQAREVVNKGQLIRPLTDFWSHSICDVIEALGTSLDGLTSDEASKRLKLYGSDLLHAKKKSSLLVFAITLLLPLTPLSGPLGLTPLPLSFLLTLGAITILYVVISEATKRLFYKLIDPTVASEVALPGIEANSVGRVFSASGAKGRDVEQKWKKVKT